MKLKRNVKWTLVCTLVAGAGLLSVDVLFSGNDRPATGKSSRGAEVPRKKTGAPSRTPLVPHRKFSKNCSTCHLPTRWDVMRPDFKFDHKKETGYPLLGAHARASCLACHNDRGLAGLARKNGCAACHQDPHKSRLGPDCAQCHVQTGWPPVNQILQHAKTRFPLTGLHQTLDCASCHTGAKTGDYKGVPVACISCHGADYQRGPQHAARNYPKECTQCHRTTSWSDSHFTHAALGASAQCITCHDAEYRSAPGHVAGHYATTCGQCHQTNTWAGAPFNHNAVGGLSAPCYACHVADYQSAPNHVPGNYPQQCVNCHKSFTTWLGASGKPDHSTFTSATNCYSCHTTDYQTAPNHTAHGYPTTCGSCHTPTAPTWVGAPFNHNAVGGTGATCYTCHAPQYSGAPQHTTKNYPKQCYTCHKSFTTWTTVTFNHSTWFNLTKNGNHNSASCTQCHTGGVYTSFTCLTCHPHSSKSNTDSHHIGRSGYSYGPTTCYNCHKS